MLLLARLHSISKMEEGRPKSQRRLHGFGQDHHLVESIVSRPQCSPEYSAKNAGRRQHDAMLCFSVSFGYVSRL